MKQKLFWILNILLNSGRIIAVLAIIEKATGLCLDWPNGTEAMPQLVAVADASTRPAPVPYIEIEIEKAANQ